MPDHPRRLRLSVPARYEEDLWRAFDQGALIRFRGMVWQLDRGNSLRGGTTHRVVDLVEASEGVEKSTIDWPDPLT